MRLESAHALGTINAAQKEIIAEASYLRGSILTSYAQVEFMLADISVKLDLKFPYLIKKRIKAVLNIADRAGYEGYREELQKVCNDLLQYDDVRNFMAHALLVVKNDKKQNHQLEYRMYERVDESFRLLIITTDLTRLRKAASDVAGYTMGALKLFQRIYREKGLEAALTS